MNRLRQVGRASLFSFIAQYVVYVTALARLRLYYSPLWPVLFICSILFLIRVAGVWDRHNGNRLFTVGLLPLIARLRERRSAVTTVGGGASLFAPGSRFP